MRRRKFIIGSAAFLSAPAASAQAPEPTRTIGFLVLPARTPPSEPYYDAFEEGLREGGFAPGREVKIEYRFANNELKQLPTLVTDLLQRDVSLIATPSGLPAVLEVKHQAATLPIIGILGDDAVQPTIVESLSHPGGTVTGIIAPLLPVLAKQLQLAHELLAGKIKVGVLVDANYMRSQSVESAAKIAGKLGIEAVTVAVASESELEPAVTKFVQEGVRAMVVS